MRSLSGLWRPSAASRMSSRWGASFPLVALIVYSHAIGCFRAVATVCSVKDELKVSCLIPIGRLNSVQYSHAIGCFRAAATVCSIKDELKVRCLIPIGRLNSLLSCYWLFPGCGDRLQHQGWAQDKVPHSHWSHEACIGTGCFRSVAYICNVVDKLKITFCIPIGQVNGLSPLAVSVFN